MVRAQSAIVRTSVAEFTAERQRNRPWLVVASLSGICLGIGVNQCFERPAIWAALAHIDLVVAQNHLGVDHLPALGADAAGQFIEDVVGVLFHNSPNG